MPQFLADMLNRPVEVPKVTEATALGAAILAGLAVGLFARLEATEHYWQRDIIYTPVMTEAERKRLYAGWKTAVQSLLHASGNAAAEPAVSDSRQ